VHIPIRILDPGLPSPQAQHADDAGCDLYAREGVLLAPGGGRAIVPTGIAVAVPTGYGGFVLPRSGLALRHGVTIVNAPGLVDPGYHDEVKVVLVNTDPAEPYAVTRGDRIAQLVVQRVELVEWTVVDDLGDSERGVGGFGSTGY